MIKHLLPLIGMGVVAGTAQAGPSPSLTFGHKDWSLVCDNTRTCRAAGYHARDGASPPVSVLLTRKAGPGEPVTVQLKLLPAAALDGRAPAQGVLPVAMRIGARALGSVAIDRASLAGTLASEQVDALLAALAGTATVSWSAGDESWQLSGAGATAVLLKMDEFQGRLGTVGALVRKGGKPDSAALPALAAPVVTVPPLPATPKVALTPAMKAALLPLLRKTAGPDDCAGLYGAGGDDELSAMRLTNGKLLVSTLCSSSAYNVEHGWWVANERAPYAPVLLPADGHLYRDGTIVSHRKGRGIGDCWEAEEWTWDGRTFVLTRSSDGGECREIPGGWDLPTFVTTVRRAGA